MQLPCVPVRMQSHAVTVCSSAHAVACNCRVFQFACISHAFAFIFPLSVITLMRGVVLTCMAFFFKGEFGYLISPKSIVHLISV
jgi:hypothetical protein